MTNLRQFGIELEAFNPDLDRTTSGNLIEGSIRRMGYPAKFQMNHFAAEYDRWQIKPDSSISCRNGSALEVVSRTLPGNAASIEEVRKVAAWMSSNGYDVNSTMGYHIHIDAADMTVAEAAAVAFRYESRRAEFNAILPRSRHAGSWARPLGDSGALDKVRNAVLRNDVSVSWDSGERYAAVNLQHAHKRRSERRLEFRQHSGTLNGDKIIGWYKLLCDFIAETLKLVREEAAQPLPISVFAVPVAVAPIVRRQRTRRGATRSFVVGTEAPSVPDIAMGTDYDLFLRNIEANGVVTQQHARELEWDTTRLRVTAHWLRRNGAALVTTERNGELAYVGVDGATTREAIFVNPAQVRRRVDVESREVIAAPVPERRPAVAPRLTNREELLGKLANAPILQGASAEVAGWYRDRRSDFASL